MLPAKSTPAACTISLTGMTARSAPPAATIPVASVPRGVTLTLIFSAMPSCGKRSGRKPDTAGASRDRNGFRLEQDLFEGLDGAHVELRSPSPHRHAEGYSRKIHGRSGGDSLRANQLTEALPGEDHHVGRHAAGELRSNRLR